MEKYDNYKDSGIEWIGEIPEHWSLKRLKYLVSLNDETLSEKTDEETVIEYIEIGDLKNGGVSSTEYYFVNAPSRARRIVRSGDVIVSTVRTYLKAIAQISEDKDGFIASTGFAVLRPQAIDSRFLGYYSHSPFFIDSTIANSVGVTYPAINAPNILDFPIQIPTPEEQTAIANYLDRKTTEIDELIADKKRLLELYEEEKTAIINQAVTKGINSNVPMKDSGIEWLDEIPEHWEVKNLRYLCKITTGGKDTENREDDGEFPFFVRSQTVEKISTYSYDGEAILTAGDGVGVCKVWHHIIGKFDFHQRVYMMYDFDGILGSYLFHYMKENFIHDVLKKSAKSTVDSLRRPMFLEFAVAFPKSEDEQKEIVQYIENEITRIDSKTEITKKLIDLLTEYRTALISEVVTGKIKVI